MDPLWYTWLPSSGESLSTRNVLMLFAPGKIDPFLKRFAFGYFIVTFIIMEMLDYPLQYPPCQSFYWGYKLFHWARSTILPWESRRILCSMLPTTSVHSFPFLIPHISQLRNTFWWCDLSGPNLREEILSMTQNSFTGWRHHIAHSQQNFKDSVYFHITVGLLLQEFSQNIL